MQGPGIWNGVPVLVTLSDESTTGFLNVLKQPGGRKKPYYVKFKPDGEKRQRTLPGSSSSTAWEAACKYGYYLATKTELSETETRNPRRSSEVSCCRPVCSSPHSCLMLCACRASQEIEAEKEAKRAEKEAKRAEKLAKRKANLTAENTPPLATVTAARVDGCVDGLPCAIAMPMLTPVGMPNLARAAAALGAN